MNNKLIAVTGATGQQGGAVARQLLAEGWRVRALTRDVNKPAAQELKALGAHADRGRRYGQPRRFGCGLQRRLRRL